MTLANVHQGRFAALQGSGAQEKPMTPSKTLGCCFAEAPRIDFNAMPSSSGARVKGPRCALLARGEVCSAFKRTRLEDVSTFIVGGQARDVQSAGSRRITWHFAALCFVNLVPTSTPTAQCWKEQIPGTDGSSLFQVRVSPQSKRMARRVPFLPEPPRVACSVAPRFLAAICHAQKVVPAKRHEVQPTKGNPVLKVQDVKIHPKKWSSNQSHISD